MPVSDQIRVHLPYLRRYARALTGSQNSGDAYVRATLEAALADRPMMSAIAGSRVGLYTAFTRIWESSDIGDDLRALTADLQDFVAQGCLSVITPIHRQALLLTTLEDFTPAEAGAVLAIAEDEVDLLLAQAISEIESLTNILIIEDEPLISMQLEQLVTELGHRVIGTAATRTQALEMFEKSPAGLVLADIQLADGSSGIDAVEDLLKFGSVPVIFITAYPEKLLTGERSEPTYLVTKPFHEATVRAAISQALFFGTTRAAD
jgi:CheY-like chemotaxis protein